ncbi:hypothetical protein [Micromonospora sp. DT62]|uniref:hypothetical protein n=1 Tax=Micromonospora sp. DT62 TaxID=3416521 RepID=UPI003CF2E495
MTVSSYRLGGNKIAWYYVIDLAPGQDGKRRQQKRRGFPKAAAAAEKAELQSFGHAAWPPTAASPLNCRAGWTNANSTSKKPRCATTVRGCSLPSSAGSRAVTSE